jgi:hypothetical protein
MIGIPNVTVIGIVAPVAVVIEIFVTDNIARQILRRARPFITVVALISPVVELILLPNVVDFRVQSIGAAESALLSGVHREGFAVAGGLTLTFAHADYCVAAVFAGLEPIAPRLINRKSLVGSVDLEDIVTGQPAYSNIQRSGCELDLHGAIIQVKKRHASIFGQPNRRRPQLQFGARTLVRPDLVSGCHRTVWGSLHPILFSGGVE